MIEWIRTKFSSMVSLCFVLYIVAISISGAITGFGIGRGAGLFFGLVLGVLVGILSGILIFGLYATIINISESNEALKKELKDISEKLGSYASAKSSYSVSSASPSNTAAKEPDVWICPKCGATNPGGTKFCQKCGN